MKHSVQCVAGVDDADTGRRTRVPALIPRRKMSAAQIHEVHVEQGGCIVRSAPPPRLPKPHKRQQ